MCLNNESLCLFLGLFVVEIVKFGSDWITFEHRGSCYSIDFQIFSYQELSKISEMSFTEVKAKYNVKRDEETDGACC